MRLLTWQGMVLVYDLHTGRLSTCDVSRQGHASLLLQAKREDNHIHLLVEGRPEGVAVSTGPICELLVLPEADCSSFELIPTSFHGVFHLSVDSRFLNFTNNRLYLDDAVTEQSGSYLLLDDVVFERLRYIKSQDWIQSSNGKIISRHDIVMSENYAVTVDGRSAFIAENSFRPVGRDTEKAAYAHLSFGLGSGWRWEEYRLYRPLVFFAIFDSEVHLKRLRQSLRSLREIASFNGDVVLLTNLPNHVVAEHLGTYRTGVETVTMPKRHAVEPWASRYRIFEWEHAWRYQPLLYVDSDVVFDRAIDDMLPELTMLDRLAAGSESFSHYDTSDSVGCGLFRQDGYIPGGVGFNSGIICIPNVAIGAYPLALIYKTACKLNESDTHVNWRDQPVANYIGAKLHCFDMTIMTRLIRSNNDDPSSACGFVHFWGEETGYDKRDRMDMYISRILSRHTVIPTAPAL